MRAVTRKCERPYCSERATVAYRFDAGRRIVFFDHLREGDPQAAGALCNRHADAMVLPRGWWLDDRRVPVPRLFAAGAERAPRAPRRRAVGGTARSGDQLSLVDAVAESEETRPLAPPEEVDDPTGSWTPAFDEGDDLDGLLSATTPLLSRAFRSRRDDEDETAADDTGEDVVDQA